MRKRYGPAEQFLKLFTPDLQIATARNEARAYLGSAPSLEVIAEGYGWQTVIVWLCIQIENLNNFTGVREKMTVARQKDLAALILGGIPELEGFGNPALLPSPQMRALRTVLRDVDALFTPPRSCNSRSSDARTSSVTKRNNRASKRMYCLPSIQESASLVKNISNKNV